jgi:SAM-dependent methyltransferase
MKSPRDLLRRLSGALPSDDQGRYERYTKGRLQDRPFINVGAGKFSHPYWTNVDYASDWYGGIQPAGFVNYDLTRLEPLPFDDGALELVYTSHTIEHVGDAEAQNLFSEAHRVLRPGGGLRITCPDSLLLFRSYRWQLLEYWRWRFKWFRGPLSRSAGLDDVTLEDFLVSEIATAKCRHYVGCIEHAVLEPEEIKAKCSELVRVRFLDWLVEGLEFRPEFPGDHINWWDEQKLIAALKRVGFRDVYASRRGQSLFSPMTNPELFDTTHPFNSLYVEARR